MLPAYCREYTQEVWKAIRGSLLGNCTGNVSYGRAFDKAVQALQNEALEVEEYISSIGYETFAFARFPRPRFGHDTSNIAESTNSAWCEIRELPPL